MFEHSPSGFAGMFLAPSVPHPRKRRRGPRSGGGGAGLAL